MSVSVSPLLEGCISSVCRCPRNLNGASTPPGFCNPPFLHPVVSAGVRATGSEPWERVRHWRGNPKRGSGPGMKTYGSSAFETSC